MKPEISEDLNKNDSKKMETLKADDLFPLEMQQENVFKNAKKPEIANEILEEFDEHFPKKIDEDSEITTADKEGSHIQSHLTNRHVKKKSDKKEQRSPGFWIANKEKERFDEVQKFTITEAFVCIAELQKFLTSEKKKNADKCCMLILLI